MTIIEKLEAATGPDRELDYEIALANGWKFNCDIRWGMGSPHWRLDNKAGSELGLVSNARGECPNFTKSIDAAMTLVPEGVKLIIDAHHNIVSAKIYWAPLNGEDSGHEEIITEGANIPLAICIAAIKAKGIEG